MTDKPPTQFVRQRFRFANRPTQKPGRPRGQFVEDVADAVDEVCRRVAATGMKFGTASRQVVLERKLPSNVNVEHRIRYIAKLARQRGKKGA